ncbi:hypothetical protein [Streptomyces sp. NRRL B-24484]|uniref:hypothetical protein n=1 Tax=Streptomyces sp. NRRL B-24484 TaxID=1463833 RepID=UPI0004C21C50|nr:hypothetical protein [Streptomyces sp. NRRL B-24484]
MSIRRRAYPEALPDRARRNDGGTGRPEGERGRDRAARREEAGRSTASSPAAGRRDDEPWPPAADTAAP